VKLSVIIPTKNDEQNQFLSTVLEQMAPLPIEVIVVDWGSEIPIEFPKAARLIRVSPEIAARYDGNSYFNYIAATNVGMRRATGEYLSYFGNDTFVDDSLLTWLDSARPDSFYYISRKNIATVEEKSVVPVAKMTKELHAGGGMVAHRDIWQKLQGFDERMIYWGWMDHEVRLRAQIAGIPIRKVYQVSVYHFLHPHPKMRKAGKINERVFPSDMIFPTAVAANDEHWGLAGEQIEDVGYAHASIPG
jgi:glycosyltransferase involved in cell wall biosynthesis